ncbi:anti-sigma B factor antagonist [Streptomyces sp. V4I8]
MSNNGLEASCLSVTSRRFRPHALAINVAKHVETVGVNHHQTPTEIQAHTDAATTRSGVRVIVDLRPVEFLDCSTLGLLCRTRRRALERGGQLTLVCVRPWHLRILKAAGLHTLFALLATVEDALEGGQ